MRAIDRLNRIKQQKESNATLERFISLTNPKNVILMQALVAWTCSNIKFDGEVQVNPDATLDELWNLSDLDTREFADTAGLTVTDAISKLRQMRNLGLIFPDGDALSKAISIVKVYVKGKIEGLSKDGK